MNARTQTVPLGDPRVSGLLAQIERLFAERRDHEAMRLLHEAEAQFPGHPALLHERARRLLAAGDAAGARGLLERVVTEAPDQLPYWLSYAAALRRLEAHAEEMRALERALALDPTHLIVLLQKAALLDLTNRPRAAAGIYADALQTLAPGTRLPPPVEAHLAHARQRVAQNSAELAAMLEPRLGAVRGARDGAEQARANLRFERCLDRMLGRRRIYTPEPTFMLYPYLENYEYYDRSFFPWLAALESRAEEIRQELLGVLAEDRAGIQPYVDYGEGLPLNQWRELNHSRRWGAYFLWNQGERVEAHMARCPRTIETLASLPQVDIAGRGPTAFFSILEPHTRIPAHTGITNTRLTVHLPLIVPPGCRFRVGGETREWRAGEAWVFDDSVEHEAWNDSDSPRAILIFDVWNPQLSVLERDLVRELMLGIIDYNAAEGGAGPSAGGGTV